MLHACASERGNVKRQCESKVAMQPGNTTTTQLGSHQSCAQPCTSHGHHGHYWQHAGQQDITGNMQGSSPDSQHQLGHPLVVQVTHLTWPAPGQRTQASRRILCVTYCICCRAGAITVFICCGAGAQRFCCRQGKSCLASCQAPQHSSELRAPRNKMKQHEELKAVARVGGQSWMTALKSRARWSEAARTARAETPGSPPNTTTRTQHERDTNP